MNDKIQSILERGVSEVIVKKDLEEKLKTNKKLKVKFGIDPTGPDLHLGHMVVIKKLQEFLEAGHEVILLFGNFTAQIGDPSGKIEARDLCPQAQLEKNANKYLDQVKKILDISKIKVRWNADWLSKLSFKDVINLAQTFTVGQMIERDMYQARIQKNQPIYMHEFLYPLMQGYDSVALESDVELGGTDQTFNLLAGRTIQKAYGMTPQNILTVPILVGTDGKEKMGKSLNNYIGVNETPKEMFGKTMSIPDDVILDYFKLSTNVSQNELEKIKEKMEEGENPRNLKIRLAKEIVSIYHSKEDANREEQEFINIFAKKGLPSDIQTINIKKDTIKLLELISISGFDGSKGEMRRLILQGGVKIDETKISDIDAEIDLAKEKVLQVGKKFFVKVQK